VIIEAAINGQTSKDTNPHVPKEPAEIAADSLACIAAGAAVIHNHIDLVGASEDETVARYLEGWRPVLAARPDALVYPTVRYGTSISYEHLGRLAESGLLRIGIVDPGSVNLGGVDADGGPADSSTPTPTTSSGTPSTSAVTMGSAPASPFTSRGSSKPHWPGGEPGACHRAPWSSSTSPRSAA
jgi:hypothetical protein